MDFPVFLIQCLNALQYGLLLFLVASGLTLIFGIMGVINLAHGSFYMIGAYMAYALAPIVGSTFGGGFFATMLVGLVLAVLLGYVLEWAFFSFLYERCAACWSVMTCMAWHPLIFWRAHCNSVS